MSKHTREVKKEICAYGPLSQFIDELKDVLADHPDAQVNIREEYGSYEFVVTWRRPETENERKFRLESEARAKKFRKNQYLKLKEEFENEK